MSAARATFDAFALGASRDLEDLRKGVLHSRIRVPLEHGGQTGEVIIEVGEGDEGLEVSVLASTFAPVRPSTEGVPLALPLDLLYLRELSDGEWASLSPEQSVLRTLIRRALAQPVRDHRMERAQVLHVRHLKTKPKFWKGHELFFSFEQRGKAYFERRHRGGVRILALVKADYDHPLSVLLEAHAEVEVEIAQVFDPSFQSCPVGDLRLMKEAQRELARYIGTILPKIGYVSRGAAKGAVAKAGR